MASDVPVSFCFSVVPPSSSAEAYSFHRHLSSSNPLIWPREEQEIERFAENGELFGVRSERGQLVGLCYATLDKRKKEWEIGGLAVSDRLGKLGVGTMLTEFALAHTLAFNQPWANGQQVVAYVHEGNNDPRKLANNLGFEFLCRVKVSARNAPPSMKRDAEGNLVGDKFRFTVEGLHRLCRWLTEFNGTVRSGRKATFDLGRHTLDGLKKTLTELAAQYSYPSYYRGA
jgi:Acetyltransferase (GNAT) family